MASRVSRLNRRLKGFRDTNELVRYIEHSLRLEVGEDENGVLGVWVVDKPVGAMYAFKRGVKKAQTHSRSSEHGDAESARNEFLETALGRSPFMAQRTSNRREGGEDLTVVMPSNVSSVSSTRASTNSVSSRSSVITGPESEVGRGGYAQSVVSRSSNGASGYDRGDIGDLGDVQDEDDVEPVIRGRGRSAAKSKGRGRGAKRGKQAASEVALALFESAKELHAETETMFGPEELWNRKVRARDYQNQLSKLSAKATKVSALVGVEGSIEMADSLYRLSVKIEEESSLMKSLRESFQGMIDGPMQESQITCFNKLGQALLSNIFSTTAFALTSKGTNEALASCIKMLRMGGDQSLSVGLLSQESTPDKEFAISCQRNIWLCFLDRVARKLTQTDFCTVMDLVSRQFQLRKRRCNSEVIDIQQLDPPLALVLVEWLLG